VTSFEIVEHVSNVT